MAMKQLARRLQPLPLYFVLGLTVCLFFLELVFAHATHSLTLLLDAYHGLCNIIVLVGTIISSNHGSGRKEKVATPLQNSQEELKSLSSLPNKPQMCSTTQPGPERSLRNTFGWARVDVLVMLIGCVFLVCLCFSVVCEALQTLVHISHHDEMHGPVPVLVLGVVALILNLLAYVLIGGYTFHHGSFLSSSEEALAGDAGDAVVNNSEDSQKAELTSRTEKRQGLWGLTRDCVGCVVVIICSIVVYSTEKDVAKYVDPLFSILSAVLVLLLSCPFMKESGCILMQTIPDHINIGSLCNQLVTAFPDIVNVHELHVWKLTRGKTYCTAHIIFLNPKEYLRIMDDISQFFLGKGITHVTIQPEFYRDKNMKELVPTGSDCLIGCYEDVCMERHCCASRSPSLESVHVDSHKHECSSKPKSSKCSKQCSSAATQAEAVQKVAEHSSVASKLKCSSASAQSEETVQKVAAICASELSELHKHIETDTDVQSQSTVLVRDSEIQATEGAVKSKLPERETSDV